MSNPILQTDTQDIIAGLLGAFVGVLGSLIIEWYKKRRHPKEILYSLLNTKTVTALSKYLM